MSRSINLLHHHHQQHHRRSSSSTSHLSDPQILSPFDYNLIYYFNFIPDQPTTTTTTTLNQLIPTRNTLENQSKHDSVFASVSVSRYCSRSVSVSVCGMRVYRVRTRLRRHRLPAQRGVRHHQRLVQLQSARRQGLRQLSDLQAQERLRQQPGESLLVVVG